MVADDIVSPADIVEFIRAQLDNPTKTVHTTPGWAKAVRAILDLHSGAHECSTYRHGAIDNCTWCLDATECSTVLLLAAPFAGEPGWDPSWTLDA